jgi:integrase
MLLAGNPIEYISKRLGHSSIRVTYDIYTHLIPSATKEAVEKLEALFKK